MQVAQVGVCASCVYRRMMSVRTPEMRESLHNRLLESDRHCLDQFSSINYHDLRGLNGRRNNTISNLNMVILQFEKQEVFDSSVGKQFILHKTTISSNFSKRKRCEHKRLAEQRD